MSDEPSAEPSEAGGVPVQPATREREAAVGVRFGPGEPVLYYRPAGLSLLAGDSVVVQVDRCTDIAEVICLADVPPDALERHGGLLRPANERDLARRDGLEAKCSEAMALCRERIEAHSLPMRLIGCHSTLDGRRLVFRFSAESRVDFRGLVRDLARSFHCRIELRQIGVRDHARMIGGLGPCGRPLCCAQFLRNFEPVSIRAAKDQGIALNPGKLSGLCDRLMCCLLYEHQCYRELTRNMPKVGAVVETPQGPGRIEAINLLTQSIVVGLEDGRRVTFQAADLGFGPEAAAQAETDAELGDGDADDLAPAAEELHEAPPPDSDGAAVSPEPTPSAQGRQPASGDRPSRPRRWRRRRRPSGDARSEQ